MNKQEVLKHLKSALDYNSLRLPEYVDFKIVDRQLQIHVGINTGKKKMACLGNMQNDEAAFEGWSICLKHHLKDFIDSASLSWDSPCALSINEQRHYNRFLYRALRFAELFSWFSVSSAHVWELADFEKNIIDLFINTPQKDAGTPSSRKISEKQLEYDPHTRELLKEEFGFKAVDHQLPVGVKKQGKAFFTGHASAIDLWGVDNDDCLHLIELKYRNKKVGIISELLFYLEVMFDVFFAGRIGKPNCSKFYRGAEYLYGPNACKASKINAHFMTDELHPLVSESIALLNTNSIGVCFNILNYKLGENESNIGEIY
ncbi:MAG: hypothetical protein JW798_07755 [Prolixibacteraceae bacterium]|nr:hypothetical protein [Prolixibacteraceae bacterium]MBN2747525.1 hypothetical protein [Bacteroidales bacterium]